MERMRMMPGATLKALVAAGLIGAIGTYSLGFQAHAQDNKKKPPAAMDQQVNHAKALSASFRDVYKAVAASVVNIRSTQRLETTRNTDNDGRLQPEPNNPLENDPFFRRFFGDEGGPFRFGPSVPTPPTAVRTAPRCCASTRRANMARPGFMPGSWPCFAETVRSQNSSPVWPRKRSDTSSGSTRS